MGFGKENLLFRFKIENQANFNTKLKISVFAETSYFAVSSKTKVL